MKITPIIIGLLGIVSLHAGEVMPVKAETIPNPAIDYLAFQKLVNELGPVREKNRLTEAEFIEMASDPNTVVLDARNEVRYQAIHVKGAVNLPFSEFTAANLAKIFPNKNTRILIYCNNNFENDPINLARKTISVSLNVPTFINLHAYGYANVYELGPLLDVHKTKISFNKTKDPVIKALAD